MIGQTLRGYEIKSELGAGGYGAVYLAHDASVNRDVAIKMILPEHANNADFKQRFETEARLVAQLEHPHIIPLYSYWQDEQGAFLVMRLVRGGSLRDLIKKQGAVPLSQVERWLTQLSDALGLAHQQGIVHRDLKPDNVLLDDLGNAYLTDFGIAKQIQSADKLTATDSIMGTWHYLSPEQIQSQPVSPASDIYALGLMLFEMLIGEHPFKDATATMLVMKHLQEPLPALQTVRSDLPIELDDVIQKATAKEIKERYQTTSDLLDDFKDVLNPTSPTPSISKVDDNIEPLPLSQEERNRYAMLTNVHTFWVEGVLEQSLYNMVWIELGMAERADAVENPWQTVLKVPDSPDETLSSGTTISEVFDRLQGKMLILGEPGSGKTTTLLTLARDLLLRAEWDSAHPMPVVFNLSSWAQNRKPLNEWMMDELNLKYQVPRKMGQQWIEGEQILPLLDGLDEVAEEHRDACVDMINDYRTEHGFLDVIVCSRINDYNALTNKLRLNGAITLQPLQRQQVDVYLAQAGDGLLAVRQVLEEDEKLRRLTTSPLMLNILTLAYRDLSVDEIQQFDTLEGRRKHLFETYVDRMLARRGVDDRYTSDETKKYLSWLGKRMSKHALSVFYIERLQYDWLSSRRQRGIYKFIFGLFPAVFMWIVIQFIIVSIVIISTSILRFFFQSGLSELVENIISILMGLTIVIPPIYYLIGSFELVPLPKIFQNRVYMIKPVEQIRWLRPKHILRLLLKAVSIGSLLSPIMFLFQYLDFVLIRGGGTVGGDIIDPIVFLLLLVVLIILSMSLFFLVF